MKILQKLKIVFVFRAKDDCFVAFECLKSRPDVLDQKLILMPQQKTIILRT
jgi:hypothetical protein